MLFVDTNIFIYAAGKEHPNKLPSIRFLEQVAKGEQEIATSSEILQEILYRFWAIQRVQDGFDLFDRVKALSDIVLPVGGDEVQRARALMEVHRNLPPRDAVHAATMVSHRISTIVSYDEHFDDISAVKRIEPE